MASGVAHNLSAGQIRTFIAVELSDAAKAETGRLISSVAEMGIQGVRTVRPGGIHLTLRFLGDVDCDALPRIASAIRTAAVCSHPFDLSLGEVGAFPNTASARVLWVGVDGDTCRLRRLREGLEDELSGVGFRRDRRRFNPHITLARLRDRVSRSDRRRVVEAVSAVGHARLRFRVKAVTLFRSVLHAEGSIHTPMHHARFGDGG